MSVADTITANPFDPIEVFRAALSMGDGAGVARAHVDGDVTIIDNVAPFIWIGSSAVADWLTSMAVNSETRGLSEQNVIYGPARTELVDGDRAYGNYPAEWTYLERDEPRRDRATIAFALRRTVVGWKIAGWSWNPSA